MENIIRKMKGDISVDDRGRVSYINDFDFKDVKRFYMVENHEKGFIRAWHGHKNEGKYVYVVSGTALVGVVNLKSESIYRYVFSADKPTILYVPPNHANGFMTLTDDAKLLFFSTSTLEDSLGDDIRFNWDKWDIWEIERR
jgi:dTDP-4-dehydrorhamnose 3,5-epimerase|tara:strand:- start:1838 stop:2260 length:423 start_codon:yes stop_codon:yes gene_type:complete